MNEKKMFGHSAGNSKSLGAPKFVSRYSRELKQFHIFFNSRDDLFDSAWGLLQVGGILGVLEPVLTPRPGGHPDGGLRDARVHRGAQGEGRQEG